MADASPRRGWRRKDGKGDKKKGKASSGSLDKLAVAAPTTIAAAPAGGLSGTLTVLIIGAEKLNPQYGDGCDPYCVLRFDNDKNRSYRTGVRKRTLAPFWNEVTKLQVAGANELEVTVKDWSRKKFKSPRIIGKGVVDLHALLDGSDRDVVVELFPEGTLNVSLRFDDVSCLFGLPLNDVCSREGGLVPLIIKRFGAGCVSEITERGLDSVGLYRISGRMQDVKRLRDEFIRDAASVDLSPASVPNVATLAALLKMYLRDLPEPLFTAQLYPSFMEAAKADMTTEARLRFFQGCIAALPKHHLATVVMLFDHFVHVVEHSEKNLMTSESLATCLGPSLFTPAENDETCMVHFDIVGQNATAQFLIDNWTSLGIESISSHFVDAKGVDSITVPAPSDAFGREVSEESRGRARFGSTRMDGTKVDVPSIAVTIPGDKRLSVMSAAPDLQTPPNNGLLLPDRAGPLTSPGAESERKLSMTLFRQFDRTQSGELTREAFQDLCSMAGVPEDSPKVKEITSKNSVLTYKHFREALADDVETESRNAARARAKSVNHLMRVWEARSKGVVDTEESTVNTTFSKYAKKKDMSMGPAEFQKAAYDLGMYLHDPKAEFESAMASHPGGPMINKNFSSWWKARVRPVVGETFRNQDQRRDFLQAVNCFQFYDEGNAGAIPLDCFKKLHGELQEHKFAIDGNVDVCLKQIRAEQEALAKDMPGGPEASMDASKLAFNAFVRWLVKGNALGTGKE